MVNLKFCSWLATLLVGMGILTPSLSAAIVQTGNVSPHVSEWHSSSPGLVGITSYGSVRVDGGSVLASRPGALGYGKDVTGTATVSGTGSKWVNAAELFIGTSGHGLLTIEAGGEVSNVRGRLGMFAGSSGTATVTGTGSKWISSDYLDVGSYGNGTLTIEAGGQVSSIRGFLGGGTDSFGTVTITGAGSQWINNQKLLVGNTSHGILGIEAGGQAKSGSVYLGNMPNSTGSATVTGIGSKLSSVLFVGSIGRGTLDITDGGLVSVPGTLTIDSNLKGDSFINIATGGMLALYGDADNSLSQFFNLISGTDAIRYWDATVEDWAPLTSATYGDNYTLEYLTTGELAGYTLLTVGTLIVPEPATWILAMALAMCIVHRHRN